MRSKFSIGQRIVAIEDHHNGSFKKGEEFTVLDIICVCLTYGIKIREGNVPAVVFCTHGVPWIMRGDYYEQSFFAPIQEVGEMTFEEVMDMVEPKKKKIEIEI